MRTGDRKSAALLAHDGRFNHAKCGFMRETAPSLRESVRHRGLERASTPIPPAILAETSMTSTDLDKLDIEQLADLLGNAQAEMAAREKHNRCVGGEPALRHFSPASR